MNNLREDLRVGILGAAAGLFSISVSLLIGRIDAYYAYLTWLDETHWRETYNGGVENLWWVPIGIWHLILSITASLLAHRHLRARLTSPFLLWQVIGTASLLGWGLTVLLVVGMECLMNGSLYPIEPLFSSSNLPIIAKYVAAGFACNVVYGSVMKACYRQYTAQFDELASESSNIDHLLTTS